MTNQVRNLEPKAVWNFFEDINEVPRPSKKEERIIAYMKAFGENLGLPTYVDAVGNVIIKKPATPGMENRKTVVLQSHLDMVHQKNADTDFDFDTQGIQSWIDGDWVKAKGTTLGADNGMGDAAIMALLASSDIPHPALEALFTIDEETGMTGAFKLEKGILNGQILLNLDTEDDDEFSIGCAGGIDTNTSYSYSSTPTKTGDKAYKLTVNGLKGGHSGVDIILERGNANKIMNRLMYQCESYGLQIVQVDGGSLRNAIPRESFATIVVNNASYVEEFNKRAAAIKTEYALHDGGLKESNNLSMAGFLAFMALSLSLALKALAFLLAFSTTTNSICNCGRFNSRRKNCSMSILISSNIRLSCLDNSKIILLSSKKLLLILRAVAALRLLFSLSAFINFSKASK